MLGETYLRPILLGIFGIVCFYYREKRKRRRFVKYIGIWAIFFLISFFSFLATHSIPLSIDFIIFFMSSFLIFIFFLDIDEAFIENEMLYQVFVMLFSVLSLFSLFFSLYPQKASPLPGMNLLFSTYGHNHFVTFLVLIYPLLWNNLLFKRIPEYLSLGSLLKRYYKEVVLLFLSTVVMILSHSRTAALVSFSEVVIVFILAYKKNNRVISFQKLLFFVIGLFFFFALFFHALISFREQHHCSDKITFFLGEKSCKSFSTEYRPYYWKQALQGVVDFPLLGYGPGTFALVSHKYKQTPFYFSAFAHNSFFQITSEIGIPGGMTFFFLMFYLLFEAAKVLRANESLIRERLLFIGICMVYFINFFDFDWSFISIFVTTLVFLAFILKKKQNSILWSSKWFDIILHALFVVLISISLFFTLIETLIQFNYADIAFSVFPYFSSHESLFKKSNQLSEEQKLHLSRIYNFHSDTFLQLQNALNLKQWEHFFVINPWGAISKLNQDNLLVRMNNSDTMRKVALKITEGEQKFGYQIDYQQKKAIAERLFLLSMQKMKDNEGEAAADLINLSHQLNQYSLAENSVSELSALSLEQQEIFFERIKTIPLMDWGKNRETIQYYFIHFFTTEYDLGHIEQIKPLMYEYANKIEAREIAENATEVANHAYLFMYLVVDSLNIGNTNNAQIYLDKFNTLPFSDYNLNYSFTRQLQLIADSAISGKNWLVAELSLKVLGDIVPKEYWEVSQLGNYFVMRGMNREATKAYELCEIKYEAYHDICHNPDKRDSNTYWKASQIIQDIK